MDRAELQARVSGFESWHYRFDLGNGIVTPISQQSRVNRHDQRSHYFFDRLLQVTGGSLRGHRVLDLGCNSGFWSLKAAEADADHVFGIDGRQMHVDQANLVFEAKGIAPDRYRFDLGDVFTYPYGSDYDVVFCLGLLYHVSKPVQLFEVMARTGAEVIVIDSAISPTPGSVFKLKHEALGDPRHAIDFESVLVPSRQAVVTLAAQYGYRVAPLALNMTDWTACQDYRNHHRLAFICARTLPLDMLPTEPPPRAAPAGLRADAARLGERVAKQASKRLRQLVH